MTLENGLSGEMGGGTYTYLTLPGMYVTNQPAKENLGLN